MKKKIISALVAALAFAGCDEQPKQATLRPTSKPASVAVSKPIGTSTDAGQLTQAEPQPDLPTDKLVLKHDQPKVDHLERAKQLKGEGDFAGALTEARRALFGNETDEDTLVFIARIAPRTGQHAIAAEAYGRIAQQKPDDPLPLISQTRAFISAKDFKAAMVSGRDAVKLDAQNVEAWHALGRAHLSAGDLQSAIVAFEKAVELDPKHGYALNNLGLAYLRANENAAAAQVLERAVSELPNLAYVQNNLGVAYERMGHLEEAKEAYSRATGLSPKYVKARVNADRVAKLQVNPDAVVDEATPEDASPIPENTTP